MKRYKILIPLLLALFVSAPSFTGCASKPIDTTTKIAGTVTTSVDAAMNSWGAWVRAGKATLEQRVKVRDAYQKYQVAAKLAEKTAIVALNTPTEQQAYVSALNIVSQSSAELILLIESLTKK